MMKKLFLMAGAVAGACSCTMKELQIPPYEPDLVEYDAKCLKADVSYGRYAFAVKCRENDKFYFEHAQSHKDEKPQYCFESLKIKDGFGKGLDGILYDNNPEGECDGVVDIINIDGREFRSEKEMYLEHVLMFIAGTGMMKSFKEQNGVHKMEKKWQDNKDKYKGDCSFKNKPLNK